MGTCNSAIPSIVVKKGKTNLIINDVRITHRYRVLDEIPKGKRPKSIFTVMSISLQEIRILKKMPIRKEHPEQVRGVYQIVDIYEKLDNPMIPSLLEVFETEFELQLIFDKVKGKSLLSFFNKREFIDEPLLALVIFQLVNMLSYIHKKDIRVRSLDPDNLLFDGSSLYLISMNNARFTVDLKGGNGPVGEPYLMSPEMTTGKYGKSNDIWQAGVIFHLLATGEPVVEGASVKEVQNKFRQKAFDIEKFKLLFIDQKIKDVIVAMLNPDCKTRLKTTELLKLSFFESYRQQTKQEPTRPSLFNRQLNKFVFKTRFHKALHLFLVRGASSDLESKAALQEFKRIDLSGDLLLSPAEIKEALKKFNEVDVDAKCEKLFLTLDENKTGFINYVSFLALWIDQEQFYHQEKLAKYFRLIDSDQNGFVSMGELEQIFGECVYTKEFREMISKYTSRKSLDFNGFIRMIRDIQPMLLEKDISND